MSQNGLAMINPFMVLTAVAVGGILFGKVNGSEAAGFNGSVFLGIFLPVALVGLGVDVKRRIAGRKKP